MSRTLLRTRLAALLALGASSAVSAQAVVLHDNGGIVTAPGGAADGSALSAVQAALGLSITGHAAVVAHDLRVAEDFIVPAGGWRVSQFEFDAFQQGATPSLSPFDRVHVRVWNGVPDAIGSSIVFGDLATNRLARVAFANTYRVTGVGVDMERAVFSISAGVGTLVLAPGTYWLEWQIGAPRDGGPYVPPLSAAGTDVAGNALQFAGEWRSVRDGASAQGLPFRVIGASGTGGAASDTLFSHGYED